MTAPPRSGRREGDLRRSALSQLDRDPSETYAKVIESAAGGSQRAADALRDQRREFIAVRNTSFGKPDYDVRDAKEKRLERLGATISSAR